MVASVLEREKELDGGWSKECEADEVKLRKDNPKQLAWFMLDRGVGDFEEDEDEEEESANWEVDVKTW